MSSNASLQPSRPSKTELAIQLIEAELARRKRLEWHPRDYQKPLYDFLHGGGRRAVAVWHRRAGKDAVGLHWTVDAAQERVGVYWHMLPTTVQGRKVVWDGLTKDGQRVLDAWGNWRNPGNGLVRKIRNDEMKIELNNGSIWQVVGSDNYNALVGSNPVGVVFSEYSIANPAAWDFIRPILAENGGWALFIYTPRGRNHGADLYEMAKANPGWFSEVLKVDDTHAIPLEAIEDEREAGMSEDMIRQEFYCSFDAAVVGSYYGQLINDLEDNGRICSVPYDPRALVTTGWDLGYNDATVIWCAQIIGNDVHVIDYYANAGVGLNHYAQWLLSKPYAYHQHLLPHDGRDGELIAGTSVVSHLRGLLGNSVTVLEREQRLEREEGINAVRVLLPRCKFDETKCADGLKALRLYRREWNEERKTFSDRPLHDWTSDPADAFRSLATGLKPPPEKRERDNRPALAGGWMG